MLFKNIFKPVYIYHLLLFFSFCVSLNKQTDLYYVNIFFYSLSHIIIIYLSFYYFHYLLYFIFLFYGLLFDIFLLDEIGPHLLVFVNLLLLISLIKNYLYNLNSLKVFYFIFLLIFVIYFFEMVLADLFFNYNFNFYNYFIVCITSSVILLPITFLFSKLDKI